MVLRIGFAVRQALNLKLAIKIEEVRTTGAGVVRRRNSRKGNEGHKVLLLDRIPSL